MTRIVMTTMSSTNVNQPSFRERLPRLSFIADRRPFWTEGEYLNQSSSSNMSEDFLWVHSYELHGVGGAGDDLDPIPRDAELFSKEVDELFVSLSSLWYGVESYADRLVLASIYVFGTRLARDHFDAQIGRSVGAERDRIGEADLGGCHRVDG